MIYAGCLYVMVAEGAAHPDRPVSDPAGLCGDHAAAAVRARFHGAILSDHLGQVAASRRSRRRQRAIDFLDAGGDLVTSQDIQPAEQMAVAVLARASSNAAFRATVDDAAERILAAKQAQGLLPC